jgi:hypothetical protein
MKPKILRLTASNLYGVVEKLADPRRPLSLHVVLVKIQELAYSPEYTDAWNEFAAKYS